MSRPWTVLAAAVITSAAAGAPLPIIFVDDDAPPGGDGASWQTAFRFLRDALAAGGEADEVRIAGGVYLADRDELHPLGTGVRSASFETAAGLALRGGFAGVGAADPDARDPDAYPTVLSGDLAGNDADGEIDENTYHVVTSTDQDGVVLDGLAIVGGNTDGEEPGGESGAGLRILGGDVTIEACRFERNRSRSGGGISARDAVLVVIGSTFESNHGLWGAAMSSSGNVTLSTSHFSKNFATSAGGAFHVSGGSFIAGDCTFEANVAHHRGGAINVESDGLCIVGSSTFVANRSEGAAGAIRCDGELSVHDCTFTENTAERSGGAIGGRGSVVRCTFERNEAQEDGGAIEGRVETIEDCTFVGNTAVAGGAVALIGGLSEGVTTEIDGTTFRENEAAVGGAVDARRDHRVRFDDVEFFENTAALGGAIHVDDARIDLDCSDLGGNRATLGGAIYAVDADLDIHRSNFVENPALIDGDGVYAIQCEIDITNSDLTENGLALALVLSSTSVRASVLNGPVECIEGTLMIDASEVCDPIDVHGATISAEDSDFDAPIRNRDAIATVVRCRFDGIGWTPSSGMENVLTDATVVSCTFEHCTSDRGGAALHNEHSTVDVTNTLFNDCAGFSGGSVVLNRASATALTNCTWTRAFPAAVANEENSTAAIANSILWENSADLVGVGFDVRYSLIAGVAGEGNIDADPSFLDDLRLWPGSPAIDAGDNGAVPPGITTDVLRAPRFVDDPDTQDSGLGSPPIVDMGAHEFQLTFCANDVDRDGGVGLSDVLAILIAWGETCAGCPEDLDRDGTIGFGDVLRVLAAWGPCED